MFKPKKRRSDKRMKDKIKFKNRMKKVIENCHKEICKVGMLWNSNFDFDVFCEYYEKEITDLVDGTIKKNVLMTLCYYPDAVFGYEGIRKEFQNGISESMFYEVFEELTKEMPEIEFYKVVAIREKNKKEE